MDADHKTQSEAARVLSATDHYQVLNVAIDTSNSALRKSFHSLSLLLHPDKFKGGEDAFARLREAYEVLSDSQKRGEYDAKQVASAPVQPPSCSNNHVASIRCLTVALQPCAHESCGHATAAVQ